MSTSWARKGVWILGALLVLAILIVAGLPLLASTQIVRDSIAYQMSAWSGYRVRLDEAADIRVWPTFRAVLNGVTLADWDETNPHPVLEAERVEIDLSALAALRGEVVFTEMQLIRPVLRLTQEDGRLHLPQPHSWGRLARSVATARTVIAAQPANPDLAALPSDTVGEVEFSQGRVVTGAGENQTDVISSLTGVFDWPALNRSASLSATGIWRGESVSLTASSSQPLILLGGGNAPIDLSLEAAPTTASFKGVASISAEGFADGQFSLSAPSFNRLMEWIGVQPLSTTRVGAANMTARVSGSTSRLKFEDASLGLENSTGTGLLDLSFSNGRPNVIGTLAFDRLDLRALLNTFSPFPASEQKRTFSPSGFDFDLRFSATSANFGNIELTDVATAAKAKDGFATFDISDATAFGGTVQAGVRAEQAARTNAVEIRVLGEDIEAGQFASALGFKGFAPQALSSFSVVLNGSGTDLDTVLETADGTVALTLGKGSIPGLDLNTFLKLSEEGDFFPLSALGEGSLPIENATVKATLSKGVAEIESAEALSGQYRISVDGLVPVASRGLALYGTLASPDGADSRLKTPLMFFVGGTWGAPFVASFYSAMQQ